MTRVWGASFGTGNTAAGETEWGLSNTATFTHATDRLRPSGVVAGRFTGLGHVTSQPMNLTRAFARTYFHGDAAPSTAFRIMRLINVALADDILALRWNTDRTLSLVEGPAANVLFTTTTTLAVDTWHLLEIYGDVTSSVWSARINGVAAASVPYFRTSTGNIGYLSLGPGSGTTPGTTIWYADPAVNDTTGPHNCSWCGPCTGIYFVKPAADHLNTGSWIAETGGALYAEIDDLPAASIDTTTQIKETAGVSGAQAGVLLTQPPVRGVVGSVLAGVRGGGASAHARLDWLDANNYQIAGLDITWAPGWATVYPALTLQETWDGVPRALTTDYLFGTSYQPYPHGSPWTLDAPRGSQFSSVRAVRTDGSAVIVHWSALWANVEITIPYTTMTRYDRPAPRVLVELDMP